jgi:hypothetical protein
LHGIVGIVGRDVLVLAFDAGEDPEGGGTCAELITEKRGPESVLTVKIGRSRVAEGALTTTARRRKPGA